MLTLGIIFIASLAVFAACAWRAPDMDDCGRVVGPSRRDQQSGG